MSIKQSPPLTGAHYCEVFFPCISSPFISSKKVNRPDGQLTLEEGEDLQPILEMGLHIRKKQKLSNMGSACLRPTPQTLHSFYTMIAISLAAAGKEENYDTAHPWAECIPP
ncbi:uncharacterized protein RBU33_019395 [Hipposideros larvatus]